MKKYFILISLVFIIAIGGVITTSIVKNTNQKSLENALFNCMESDLKSYNVQLEKVEVNNDSIIVTISDAQEPSVADLRALFNNYSVDIENNSSGEITSYFISTIKNSKNFYNASDYPVTVAHSTNNGTFSSGSSFTNSYGTSTTKCHHSDCNNYIATSGDTWDCSKHASKCLNCGKYIDCDAVYCMSCMSSSSSSSSSNKPKCVYVDEYGKQSCTSAPVSGGTLCQYHLNKLYNEFTGH